MTRQLIVLAFLSQLAFAANAQGKFVIKGKLDVSGADSRVALSYYMDGYKLKRDTAVVRNGVFEIRDSVNEPQKVFIELILTEPNRETTGTAKPGEKDLTSFFLEKGVTEITGANMKNALIKGGPVQKDYLLLQSQLKPLNARLDSVKAAIAKNKAQNTDSADSSLYSLGRSIKGEMVKTQNAFIGVHPDSYVSLDLLIDRTNYYWVLDPADPLFELLSPKMRNTVQGKKLTEILDAAKRTGVGVVAPDFTQADTSGKAVTLSSLRGKYVLIDFWASWCGPCRMENPNVVKVYQAFKDKNFEIIGVSLDFRRDMWLHAIKKDQLSWIQVSDLHFWENTVAKTYGISAVPRNLLLDPKGVIIAKDLEGEALSKKLAEALH